LHDRLKDDSDSVVITALKCKALVRTPDPQSLLQQLADMIATRVTNTIHGGGSSKSVQAAALKFITSSLLPQHPQLIDEVVMMVVPALSMSRQVC